MKKYRISPSLMNSFSSWLNSEETYAELWGNSECPTMSALEFEQKQREELIAYINREPQARNEAADRGTCLNEIVDCLIGSEPNPSIWWDKIDKDYIAERNGFRFSFDGAMVDELALNVRNAIPQYHLTHDYTIDGREITLHGFADYIFPTQIWDLKTTNKYKGEKYANNWQRKVYPVVAVDSGSMIKCEMFRFEVMEIRQNKETGVLFGSEWKESYDVNIDAFRADVMDFVTSIIVPTLDKWNEQEIIPNQTIITE